LGGAVQDVKGFDSEFQPLVLSELKNSRHRGIESPFADTANVIAAQISECVQIGYRERRAIAVASSIIRDAFELGESKGTGTGTRRGTINSEKPLGPAALAVCSKSLSEPLKSHVGPSRPSSHES
jgi:hypothetical protein